MITIVTQPRSAFVFMAALLFALSSCGRILGIEGAHVDPILEDDETSTTNDSDEQDTVEVPRQTDESDEDESDETPRDASANTDSSEEPTDVSDECFSFDNSRVKHLKSDGTLTPLPNADDAVR